MERTQLIEELADKEHASWSRWMTYLFDQCIEVGDGNYEIPAGLVKRWQRQAHTGYADLSESEKLSDRHEVEYILPLIDAHARKYKVPLEHIANQFCDRRPEESEGYTPCNQSCDCITEWCLPCYASYMLSQSYEP